MNQEYLSYICDKFCFKKTNEHEYQYDKNENKISIDTNKNRWHFIELKVGNESIWDLKKEENWIKLILCLKLLDAGYSRKHIVLEKKLDSGFLDVCLEKDNQPYYMIEVKTPKEIEKYTKPNTIKINYLNTYFKKEILNLVLTTLFT